MPTKIARILANLPPTFRALPRPTALHAIADAVGGELLQAENGLAALMLAHWLDHADRGATAIDDLARIAALYGLAPREAAAGGCGPADDEDVEAFRERLRRHVRTFLQGTVTVQGLLRVAAEALDLTIDDDPARLDGWRRRPGGVLVTALPRGDDAALL